MNDTVLLARRMKLDQKNNDTSAFSGKFKKKDA
jgi:hypothetical protein